MLVILVQLFEASKIRIEQELDLECAILKALIEDGVHKRLGEHESIILELCLKFITVYESVIKLKFIPVLLV